jgi:hypothetical protein
MGSKRLVAVTVVFHALGGARPIADDRSHALGGGDAAKVDVLFNRKSYGNFSTTVIQAFIN